MELHIKETGETKHLYMRIWEGDQWGADFFNDAECNVEDGSTVTDEEYQERRLRRHRDRIFPRLTMRNTEEALK